MLIEFTMERSDEGSQCAICTDDYDAQRTHYIDISAAGYGHINGNVATTSSKSAGAQVPALWSVDPSESVSLTQCCLVGQ